ncbi:MAG: MEDS domain-containing protein [Candidatus Omnitrophica bacterium]|nr:MEDS domain-containing protein [Candidatus Omnitrophota bacterium]
MLDIISYTPPVKHTALFYNSEEEYLDIVIPFIKAGLEDNEFVLWTVPETLEVKDAEAYLVNSISNLGYYIKKGQISIRDKEGTYFKNGIFTGSDMLDSLAELEKKVLQQGFKGIRGPGDGSWAAEDYWINFLFYENELNNAIEGYKLRALCTYSIRKLNINKICDIGRNHQLSLVKQGNAWNNIGPIKFK